METARFAVYGDAFRLESNDPRVHALAAKLWERARRPGREGGAIAFRVTVSAGDAPGPLPERALSWEHGEREYVASVPGFLEARIDLADARVEGRVTDGLLAASPSFAARALLEAPAALLLSRRGFTVLHAGAVVGPRGAVVVRGASGAGKSTLVAAAWRAGLGVLADESLLVSRRDPEALAAAVRDLALLPEAERLLGLEDATEEAFSGGEPKRRVDLFLASAPAQRAARRVATLLLGPRSPGPARLAPLAPAAFVEAFRAGEIPQERLAGDPDAVASAWAGRASWRLDGAADLAGAVAILTELCA